MNFDKAYDRFLAGTASEEEIAYVKSELNKLKKLEELMAEDRAPRPSLEKAEAEQYKKAKKAYTLRTAVTVFAIVLLVFAIVAGAVCGGIYGTAYSSAKSSDKVDYAEARTIAYDFAYDYAISALKMTEPVIVVTEIEKELKMESPLKMSSYVYFAEVKVGRAELEIKIDSPTGTPVLIDIDFD